MVGLEASGRVGGVHLPREFVVLVGIRECAAVEVLQSGVALDNVLELGVGDFIAQVQIVQSIEIVEPVTVHQSVDLVDKHQVEGLTEQATCDVNLG